MKLYEGLGCLMGMLKFFVAIPLWLYILYKLIEASPVPQSVMGAFWVYLCVTLVGAVLSAVVDLTKKQYEEAKLKEAMDGISRIAGLGGVK